MNKLQAMKHLLEWDKKSSYFMYEPRVASNITIRMLDYADGYEVRKFTPETLWVDTQVIYMCEIKMLKVALNTKLGQMFL